MVALGPERCTWASCEQQNVRSDASALSPCLRASGGCLPRRRQARVHPPTVAAGSNAAQSSSSLPARGDYSRQGVSRKHLTRRDPAPWPLSRTCQRMQITAPTGADDGNSQNCRFLQESESLCPLLVCWPRAADVRNRPDGRKVISFSRCSRADGAGGAPGRARLALGMTGRQAKTAGPELLAGRR